MQHKLQQIKLVITDIDGVWTDAKLHYTDSGEVFKSFSTYDGFAVALLREQGLETVIMTGENAPSVQHRADKLKIKRVFLAEANKLQRAEELCAELGLSMAQLAFIGDDLNDVALLERVGFSATVPNSPILNQLHTDIVTKRCGGQGAFREFAQVILAGHKAC